MIDSKEKRLLNTLVSRLPAKFDSLFQMKRLPDGKRGACSTYSRILAEVLTEFGITAEVRPVYMKTANRAALKYIAGETTNEYAWYETRPEEVRQAKGIARELIRAEVLV